ncbi:MAG: MFS transporter, partial [Acidobacteria bacterium]
MINYLDRTVLGIAAPQMSTELHIAPAIMGIVFSAFSWSYAVAQVPGGWVLDRVGTRLTYFSAVFFWSLFTLLQGFANSVALLLGFRLGLGISEAPCFPTNSRVVATWFPEHERAKATAIYTVGEYLGLACFSPLLFWISRRFGWRWLFFAVGTVGIAFALLWRALYREREEIGSANKSMGTSALNWEQIRELLRHRQVWGASIGQFGGNSTL